MNAAVSLPLGVELPAMPPTQDDLPCDDGMPMETFRHGRQMELLIDTLGRWMRARGNGFAGGNMFLYYSLLQVRRKEFTRPEPAEWVGPDFFAVLDAPWKDRKSWVIWEEGRIPDVVVELLSDSTRQYDKTDKKDLYARLVRIPEYFWFDPFDADDFQGFRLDGAVYRPLTPDAQGRLHSRQLNLLLGRWQGEYRGIVAEWLRWFTLEGELLLTDDEAARQELDSAKRELAAERQRAARLTERLKTLGLEPE